MSIIIKHQQTRLAELKGQLNYVTTVLNESIDTLEPWETKEYQALQRDYTQQANELEGAINRATLAS